MSGVGRDRHRQANPFGRTVGLKNLKLGPFSEAIGFPDSLAPFEFRVLLP
jgi:hypothetical protein